MPLFGVLWIWGLWIMKAVECFNLGLMDMENSGAKDDLKCGGLDHEPGVP